MLMSCVLLRCLGVQCHHLQPVRSAVPTQELHMLCETDMKHDKSFSARPKLLPRVVSESHLTAASAFLQHLCGEQ